MLFSDEVYRGLEHDPADRLPAACDLYERAISLNTVSKAYGLPGLRIGWLACREPGAARAHPRAEALHDDLLERARANCWSRSRCATARRSSSAAGSSCWPTCRWWTAFLERRGELFEWVRPTAGPIGFPRVAASSRRAAHGARRPPSEAGVLLLPAESSTAQPSHVRLGFGRANLGPRRIERARSAPISV